MVEMLGGRKFVEIPGDAAYELPPLMLRSGPALERVDRLVHSAGDIVDSESLIPGATQDALDAEDLLWQVRFGLAANMVERYRAFVLHWTWGESVLDWIQQCETSFESHPNLRRLLRPDVWPHAGRASFVTLLQDKEAADADIELENAMGYRLTFRQPPPIDFFSEKFLFFLNSSVGTTAYRAWASAGGGQEADLPPERFQFFVMTDRIREV